MNPVTKDKGDTHTRDHHKTNKKTLLNSEQKNKKETRKKIVSYPNRNFL